MRAGWQKCCPLAGTPTPDLGLLVRRGLGNWGRRHKGSASARDSRAPGLGGRKLGLADELCNAGGTGPCASVSPTVVST